MIRPDLARELVAVHVRRAAVDQRDAERRDGLGHVPRAGHVRLLRVVGLALGERAARLRREQEHLARPFREQLLEVRRPADVRGLDASAARLEPLELLAPRRVPVVREHHLLARVQSKLRQLCPMYAGRLRRMPCDARRGAMLECEADAGLAEVRPRGRASRRAGAFSRLSMRRVTLSRPGRRSACPRSAALRPRAAARGTRRAAVRRTTQSASAMRAGDHSTLEWRTPSSSNSGTHGSQ